MITKSQYDVFYIYIYIYIYIGSASNILVPDTTAYIQGFSEVRALTGQGCFGSNKETNTILSRWS